MLYVLIFSRSKAIIAENDKMSSTPWLGSKLGAQLKLVDDILFPRDSRYDVDGCMCLPSVVHG